MIMKSGNDTDVISDILKKYGLENNAIVSSCIGMETKLSKNTKRQIIRLFYNRYCKENNQKGYGIMELLAVSISHENTPISIREKVSFTKKKQAETFKVYKTKYC